MKTTALNVIESGSHKRDNQAGMIAPAFMSTGALQELSAQEVMAVAGGPESGVGTGLNPP